MSINIGVIKLFQNKEGSKPLAANGKYYVEVRTNKKLEIKKLHLYPRLTNPPIFISANHGEALGFFWFAWFQGLLKSGATLLHFDAHHDLNRQTKAFDPPKNSYQALKIAEGPANFILPAFHQKLISRYLWVLPLGATKSNYNSYLKDYCPSNPEEAKLGIIKSYSWQGTKVPDNSLTLINRQNRIVPGKEDSSSSINYEVLPLDFQPDFKIKITLFEKLSLSKELRQNLILDLDLDWYGDYEARNTNFFYKDLDLALKLFLQKIKSLELRPAFINIALSPDYFYRLEEFKPLFPTLVKGLLTL